MASPFPRLDVADAVPVLCAVGAGEELAEKIAAPTSKTAATTIAVRNLALELTGIARPSLASARQ